ncbi:MAG: hypothetical protein U0794_00800 [Isosphaeraceae bacterium]
MHPADFVRNRIQEKRISEIIELIHQFQAELDAMKHTSHSKIHRFATLFLMSVVGQLRQLGPDQVLHDDNLLAVWAELGYLGIERDRLPDDLEE